jgi:hypothetical protein
MIEAIKHLFGFCGDEHSSIFGIGLVPGVLFFGGGFISYIKTLLQHFLLSLRRNKKQI